MAEQLRPINKRIQLVRAIECVQPPIQPREIQRDPVGVDVQADLVEVGLEAGLQHQPVIDRLLELGVALFEEVDLRGAERHIDGQNGGDQTAYGTASGTASGAAAPGSLPGAERCNGGADLLQVATPALHGASVEIHESQAVEAFEDIDQVNGAIPRGRWDFRFSQRALAGRRSHHAASRTTASRTAARRKAPARQRAGGAIHTGK